MPIVLLDRMPVPSLRTYTSISVLLVACVCYFAHHSVLRLNDPSYDPDDGNLDGTVSPVDEESPPPANHGEIENKTLTTEEYMMDFAAVILQEPLCVWVFVNMAYCCLILYGKLIQRVVFGELRISEQQHMKDKFWNFCFYKFIFIFGVMNVQTMEEVVLWCAWFTVLGFIHLLAQLSKDRFEYICSSPSTQTFTHVKLLTLLIGIAVCCVLLLFVCFGIGFFFSGINTFAFMLAECLLLILKSQYVIIRYFIHLWDENRDGVWENRAIYVYYTELVFELTVLSIDFLHHLHMLLWGNIFLSMASLVICMQLRYLFYEFKRRVRRHNNYKRVVKHMHDKFPMASKEELEALDDPCAICWENMENARKLSCGHFFHNSCLRSWLEQDTTCPTCRKSFAEPAPPPGPVDEARGAAGAPGAAPGPGGPAGDAPGAQPQAPPQQRQLRNHFFHFDGSRYVSWLPSFSVEVRHSQLLNAGNMLRNLQHSQLDGMVRQVLDVFPDAPPDLVMQDLQRTRSVQNTLENIIEGEIPQSPPHPPRDLDSEGGATMTSSHQPDTSSSAHTSSPLSTVASTPNFPSTSTLSSPSSSSSGGLYPPLSGAGALQGAMGDNVYMQRTVSDNRIAGETEGVLNWSSGLHEWEDSLNLAAEASDESSSDFRPAPQGGSRFSKSADDRENMLLCRKRQMIEQAKKSYLQKQQNSTDIDDDQSEGTSVDPIDISSSNENAPFESRVETESDVTSAQARRDVIYEATRRRLQQL